MASMSVVVALFFMTIAVLCSYADAANIFTYTEGSTCGDASDVIISGAFLGGDTYRCCSSGTTYSGGVKGFDYHVRAKNTGTDHQVNVRAYDGSTSNSATNRKAAGICDKGNTASSCTGDACSWDSANSFYECQADSCCYSRADYFCLEVTCDNWWSDCEFWNIDVTFDDYVPSSWTCTKSFYDADDGCDCGCGAYDPDCSTSDVTVHGCTDASHTGACTSLGTCETKTPPPPSPSPSPPPTPASPPPSPPLLPDSWTCDASFYNSDDGCDCECGVWDPDCEDHKQDMYNCGATPSEPSPDHICKFSDGTGTCELIPTPSYIKDPDFKYQYWYLGPNGANVVAAWGLGFTGQGVHIRVNDDGLDYMNPEFSPKHLPGWKDPMPENCTTDTHGTSCAGIAAASSNNECGVGVAFNAYVSAANILSRNNTFQMGKWPVPLEDGACEADSYGGHGVDVSSNSWATVGCMTKYEMGPISMIHESCPFLQTNIYSPCGDMSGIDTSSAFYFEEYDSYLKCSASETWSEPGSISELCKWHIFIYCASSNLHTETGYMDPGCADFYDLYVECFYNSLDNAVIDSLKRGTSYGRGGRGISYVFAAGNSAANGGNVNNLGYQNSIYAISVGAIARDNQHSSYSTGGAAVLISAPGGDYDQKINTFQTLPMDAGKCRVGGSNFVGTSFAAPIVSGVVALMLEANPELGWRDVQDILVRTAVTIDIDPESPNDSWVTNAAGLSHSYEYGFGKVDAKAAVIFAQNYSATNIQHNFDLVFTSSPNSVIQSDATSTISVSDASAISSAQHVVVYVNITHSSRGDLFLSLTSPSGVTSELINFKPLDEEDLHSTETWKFMTLRNWGELPADLQGSWVLRVEDKDTAEDHGVLHSWRLEIFGNDASKNVSETLTAECAAKSGGYSDVIGGGQCYTSEKSDEELTRARSCNAASPPSNGGIGTCVETLRSGLLCKPTCDAGYFVSGVSSCSDGTFTSATCSARVCAANEHVSSKSCVACPAGMTNAASDDASGSDTTCDDPSTPSGNMSSPSTPSGMSLNSCYTSSMSSQTATAVNHKPYPFSEWQKSYFPYLECVGYCLKCDEEDDGGYCTNSEIASAVWRPSFMFVGGQTSEELENNKALWTSNSTKRKDVSFCDTSDDCNKVEISAECAFSERDIFSDLTLTSCLSGRGTQMNPATPVSTPGIECVRYCFQCTSGDTSCTADEISSGSLLPAYTVVASSTVTQMRAMPTIYKNLFACDTNDCNALDDSLCDDLNKNADEGLSSSLPSPPPPPLPSSPPPQTETADTSKNCKCSCCKGSYCSASIVASYDADSSIECGAADCRSRFSTLCPASGESGSVSASYSASTTSSSSSTSSLTSDATSLKVCASSLAAVGISLMLAYGA